jgi:hypothetical protein
MKSPARVLMLGVLVAVASLTSCAHRRSQRAAAVDPAAAVTATEQQLAQQAAALGTPQSAARNRPDCERARTLRDNVCALGQRVCLLVDGEGNVPQGAARCKKANIQCQKANTHPTIKQCVRLVRR